MVSTGKYQIFGALELNLELDLKQLLNIGLPQFKVTGGASAMMSVEWDLNDRSKSKLGLYAGRTAAVDIMQFISAQLGPFGELIRSSVQTELAMTQRIYMAFTLKPEFHFGTDFEVGAKMNCGPINDLGQTIQNALSNAPGINGDEVYKAIWPEIITTICGQPNTLSARVSFGWKGFAIDREGTYLELTANEEKFTVSLADLPICPEGASIGDSCSKNTDCYS